MIILDVFSPLTDAKFDNLYIVTFTHRCTEGSTAHNSKHDRVDEESCFVSFQGKWNHLFIALTTGESYQFKSHWCNFALWTCVCCTSPMAPYFFYSPGQNKKLKTMITHVNIQHWCCQVEQYSLFLPPYLSPMHVMQVEKVVKLWFDGSSVSSMSLSLYPPGKQTILLFFYKYIKCLGQQSSPSKVQCIAAYSMPSQTNIASW